MTGTYSHAEPATFAAVGVDLYERHCGFVLLKTELTGSLIISAAGRSLPIHFFAQGGEEGASAGFDEAEGTGGGFDDDVAAGGEVDDLLAIEGDGGGAIGLLGEKLEDG